MMRNAGPLTPAEVNTSLQPLRAAATALRVGVASEQQWDLVCNAIEGAELLERRVMPRGIVEHLRSAQVALTAIGRRALVAGAWQAVEIYLQEMEHIDTAVDLHAWQLLQLGAAQARQYLPHAAIGTKHHLVSDVGQLQGVLA